MTSLKPPTFGEILLKRRHFLQAISTAVLTGCSKKTAIESVGEYPNEAVPAFGVPRFKFKNLPAVLDDTHHISEDYEVSVLIRWGDPIFQGDGAFNWHGLTGASQARRFGYNNDFLALLE